MNNKVLYMYWAGGSMPPARAKSYDFLIKNTNCEVKLVTEDNFKEYEVEQSPIPEEFFLLSSTHQSDYARSYLMHHYGGMYSDIKSYHFDCKNIFNCLFENSEKWCIGYPSTSQLRPLNTFYKIDDKKNAHKYIGYGHFACKRNTEFTKTWLSLNNKMIKKNSTHLHNQNGKYHPRAITGGIFQKDSKDLAEYPTNYPFSWGNFIGNWLFAQKDYVQRFMPILKTQVFNTSDYR